MKRFFRIFTQLPLATAAGAFLGVLIAVVAAALSATSLQATVHPLLAFACAPLPAVLGAWIDWSRLWSPSGRTRYWSFALLALSGLAAVEAAMVISDAGGSLEALVLVPVVPLGAAIFIMAGTRALLFLGRRGVGMLGFELACGSIRRDEPDRILVDTEDGVLEVARSATTELGPNRAMDVSIGAPFAVLCRVRENVAKADPFRSERRSRARTILGVASCPSDLDRSIRKRARAWVTYLVLLAIGASVFAWAASYTTEPTGCQARGLMLKDPGWGA